MNALACYYTDHKISRLLVSKLQYNFPEQVIDLGAGQGALVRAALERWPQTNICAAEIDRTGYDILQKQFPDIRLIHSDGLGKYTFKLLSVESGSIDVAVCNPPFLRYKYDP